MGNNIMIQLVYKFINEENSVTMEFDDTEEYNEFLVDVFNINQFQLTSDILRESLDNVELMILCINNVVVLDYLR